MLSTEGYRYYVLFLDDYNKFTWIYPLKLKSDTLVAFSHFLNVVKIQFSGTIKALQSYNGGEYVRVHKLIML